MIPSNHSLLAYFLFLVAYMYHACPQRPTFAPLTSEFRKKNKCDLPSSKTQIITLFTFHPYNCLTNVLL